MHNSPVPQRDVRTGSTKSTGRLPGKISYTEACLDPRYRGPAPAPRRRPLGLGRVGRLLARLMIENHGAGLTGRWPTAGQASGLMIVGSCASNSSAKVPCRRT